MSQVRGCSQRVNAPMGCHVICCASSTRLSPNFHDFGPSNWFLPGFVFLTSQWDQFNTYVFMSVGVSCSNGQRLYLEPGSTVMGIHAVLSPMLRVLFEGQLTPLHYVDGQDTTKERRAWRSIDTLRPTHQVSAAIRRIAAQLKSHLLSVEGENEEN